jgi:hypothetical protein
LETSADNRKHEDAIEKWMLTIIDEGGVHRFDDLHIDKIDSAWKHPTHWIEGGLEAFRVARVLRDRNGLPFTVALAFSLVSGNQPRGIDFRTRKDLEARLDSASPALYLFHRGEEPRNKRGFGNLAQDLNPSMFAIQGAEVVCYFLEFLQQDADEYCWSVCIEG